jgi:signal peptidase I
VFGALVVGLGLLARRRLLLVTVTGTSMEPALRPGQSLLVRRHTTGRLRTGQVIVFRGPIGGPPDPTGRLPLMIKRIAATPGDPVPPGMAAPNPPAHVPPGSLVLLGDNTATSVDSRQRGFLDTTEVVGVVIRRLGR